MRLRRILGAVPASGSSTREFHALRVGPYWFNCAPEGDAWQDRRVDVARRRTDPRVGTAAPGTRARVVARKWGDRPHWEHAAVLLGNDEHGTWLGTTPGTTRSRPAPPTSPTWRR